MSGQKCYIAEEDKKAKSWLVDHAMAVCRFRRWLRYEVALWLGYEEPVE